MTSRRVILVLLLGAVSAVAVHAQTSATTGSPSLLLDVAAGTFYGLAVGTPEEAVFAQHGKPAGYVRLNERDTLAIYARDVALAFRNGKLSGLTVSETLLDWELAKQMRVTAPFDGTRWRLNNGLRFGTSLVEVRRTLGARYQGNSYNGSYVEGASRVHLSFANHSLNAADEASIKLRAIRIEPAQ